MSTQERDKKTYWIGQVTGTVRQSNMTCTIGHDTALRLLGFRASSYFDHPVPIRTQCYHFVIDWCPIFTVYNIPWGIASIKPFLTG